MAEAALAAAAVLGALVGGLASSYGSYRFSKVQRRHELRTEIYRDMMPRVLRVDGAAVPHTEQEVYRRLIWTASAIGSDDRRFAESIAGHLGLYETAATERARLSSLEDSELEGREEELGRSASAKDEARDKMTAALERYVRFLESRLSVRGWGQHGRGPMAGV